MSAAVVKTVSEIAKVIIPLLPELGRVLGNALKHDNPKAALKRAAAVISSRKVTDEVLNAALKKQNAKKKKKKTR